MFDVDLSKKLYLKDTNGRVSHTVEFKVNGAKVVCTARRGPRAEQKEFTVDVAKGLYTKLLNDGYRKHAFVTSIPVE